MTREPKTDNKPEDPRGSLLSVFSLRLKHAFDQSPAYAAYITDTDRVKLAASWYELSLPAVRKWFDGEAFPETPRLKDLAERLGVTVDYLLGYGTLEGAREVLQMRDTAAGAQQPLFRVPVINPHPGYADVTSIAFPRPYLTQFTPHVSTLIAAIQRGDAMGSTLGHGSFALCQLVDVRNPSFMITDGLYLFSYQDASEYTVRRIQADTPGETYQICSDNPHYDPVVSSARQLIGSAPGTMTIKAIVRALFVKV